MVAIVVYVAFPLNTVKTHSTEPVNMVSTSFYQRHIESTWIPHCVVSGTAPAEDHVLNTVHTLSLADMHVMFPAYTKS